LLTLIYPLSILLKMYNNLQQVLSTTKHPTIPKIGKNLAYCLNYDFCDFYDAYDSLIQVGISQKSQKSNES
jgi:hypothetical protein